MVDRPPFNEYAQAVWASHLAKYVDMLENVQVRATKLVDGLGNLEYTDRLQRLKLPTLLYRRMLGDMIEMYKHFNSYDKEILSPSFQPLNRPSQNNGWNQRTPNQWILPKIR